MCYPLARLPARRKERIRSQTESIGGDTGGRRTSLPFAMLHPVPNHSLASTAQVENIVLPKQLFSPYSVSRTSSATENNEDFMSRHALLSTDISATITDAVLSISSQDLVFDDPQRGKGINSQAPTNSTEAIAMSSSSPCNGTKSTPCVMQSMSNEFLLNQEDTSSSPMINLFLPRSAVTTSSSGIDGSYRGDCEEKGATICSTKSPYPSALSQREMQTASHVSSARITCSVHDDQECFSHGPLLLKEDNRFIPPQYAGAFQRRTYYQGKAVDERRNPCAPWAGNSIPQTPNSLSVNASVTSLDTLDSLPSHISQTPLRCVHSNKSNNSHSRARGYSNFRREDDPGSHIWGLSVHARESQRSTPRETANVKLSKAMDSHRRPQTVGENTSFVRLRDQVFEIGIDGRIRRQHSNPTREKKRREDEMVNDQLTEAS
ncbi:hypothetical protein FGB62_65g316 [Gracilaria domingensis]|nr:hypothetical protein FGB62_65g316 [Gracilaria domingensis]